MSNIKIEVAMFRTILLPTDFSEPSARAAKYAAAIAINARANIHVISIVESRAFEEDLKPLLKQFIHDAVDETLSILGIREKPHIQFEYTTMVNQSPANAILEASQKYQADLIVMGTHSRTGIPALLLGSVTEKVMRGTTVPLVAVGRGENQLEKFHQLPKKILAAIDFSEASKLALQQAVLLSRLWNSTLHILHVIEMTISVPYPPVSIGPVISTEPEIVENTRQALEALVREYVPEGIPNQVVILEGEPCHRLCVYSKEKEIELIVIGTQGHSKLERWLLGSTCEKLLKNVEIPIWIHPHPNRIK
ncbi:MAG: universal stress protein [bacterium]|nr:universal stress protein [bacterium]